MIRIIAVLPLVYVFLLAGCGGGGGSVYDAGATASCWSLNDDITQQSDDPDDVDSAFSQAPSAYHVTLNENEVDVAFYRTELGCQEIDRRVQNCSALRFLGEDANLDDIVYAKSNTGLSVG